MTPFNTIDIGSSRYSRLSAQQSEAMLGASMEILERTGARLDDERALALMQKAGAAVDGNRVRIRPQLVEWAFGTAPKTITFYDRNGAPVMPVGGGRSFFGTGSDCLYIIDHRTWERRKPVLQDVIEGIAVCDALQNIDFVMSMFLPSDVDDRVADRYQMEVMLNHTVKPIMFVSYDVSGCIDAVRMAEEVAGGAEGLRRKPFLGCYVNVTTSLIHNQESLQKLMFLAERGIPATYVPGIIAGTTAPVTVAGSDALGFAGALVGVVLSQLTCEGAPVIVPGASALSMDMRSTIVVYTGPDHQGVNHAMAHARELPIFSLAGASDSKAVDQQAAAEAALTLMLTAFVGGHIVHDVGYLESGMTGCLAQLTICDEIIAWIKRCLSPVETGPEALALDLIDQLGIEGDFIKTDHTLQHFREQWHPTLFNREKHRTWVERGAKTLAERAAAKVDAILAAHKPTALPSDVAARVHAVVTDVEAAGLT